MKKRLLLNLRHVPDDEADEVLALLKDHHIQHYTTPPGPLGISAGGIWIKYDRDVDRARSLFDAYQENRLKRATAEADAARQSGNAMTLWRFWRQRPWHVALMIALSVMVLLIFFAPMLQIAQL